MKISNKKFHNGIITFFKLKKPWLKMVIRSVATYGQKTFKGKPSFSCKSLINIGMNIFRHKVIAATEEHPGST